MCEHQESVSYSQHRMMGGLTGAYFVSSMAIDLCKWQQGGIFERAEIEECTGWTKKWVLSLVTVSIDNR